MIGIRDIKKVGKKEEGLEDNKEEMIIGIKKMLKDPEKNYLIEKGMIDMRDLIEEIERIDMKDHMTKDRGNTGEGIDSMEGDRRDTGVVIIEETTMMVIEEI